ncbi:MAG: DUF488 family protein [Bacteroidetes bacterium]|nr:DUF488 family protein [Bacteroidota bacterium]
MKEIIIKRVYEAPSETDGYRILVDRLWPRGVSKVKAKLDEWDKELGPSTELRNWFGHKDELFPEFARRYKVELKKQKEDLLRIKTIATKKQVCIVYGAKNEKHNQAVVIKSVLDSMKI